MCHLALTSLFSGHLRLQVLGGDVELGVLVHRRPRFTFTAAAITAAAQATTEITACGQAAEDEQGLWTKSAQRRFQLAATANITFSNQSGVSGVPESWITPDQLIEVMKCFPFSLFLKLLQLFIKNSAKLTFHHG